MMGAAAATPLQSLLTDSLALWNVRGWVVAHGADAIVVHVDGGVEVRIERRPADAGPVRWSVRREPDPARGCASIAGVLSVVRQALGVISGPGLRISPVPARA